MFGAWKSWSGCWTGNKKMKLTHYRFLLWLVTQYVPMDPTIKRIITVVVIICVVLYVLSAFGLLGYADAPLPNLRR